MTKEALHTLLANFRHGKISEASVLQKLKTLPFEDLGDITLDHHRSLRKGFPEVIYGENKSTEDLQRIVRSMTTRKSPVIITRVQPAHIKALKKLRGALVHDKARIVSFNCASAANRMGKIVVTSAGTSDIPVAEEAAVTAELLGSSVERLFDVGVAGIHRLLNRLNIFEEARAVICVAGMDGALPSVVGGIVACPVIAVPTSIGYGASFGGVAALLTMLNACSNGVSVVNIDNGFGAGYQAHLINTQHRTSKRT